MAALLILSLLVAYSRGLLIAKKAIDVAEACELLAISVDEYKKTQNNK